MSMSIEDALVVMTAEVIRPERVDGKPTNLVKEFVTLRKLKDEAAEVLSKHLASLIVKVEQD